MSYCIMRMAKIKSRVSLFRAAQHNTRERQPPNADPEKMSWNRFSGKPESEPVAKVMERYQTQLPQKVRKNAVHAVELVMTASPDFSGDLTAWKNYLQACDDWAMRQFGGKENLLHIAHHFDEETPHSHVIFQPLHEGKLNAKHFIGGHRDRMVELQNDFHEKVGKQFELDRGRSKQETKERHRPHTLAVKAADLEKKEGHIKHVHGSTSKEIARAKEVYTFLRGMTPDQLKEAGERVRKADCKTWGEYEKKILLAPPQQQQEKQIKKPRDRDFER